MSTRAPAGRLDLCRGGRRPDAPRHRPLHRHAAALACPPRAADFDGDGRIEIAYVDRPHLLADLVFVRIEGAALVERARLPGVTNHRIGEDSLSGGLRDCGQGPELVAASADWSRLLVIGWDGGPVRRDAGAFSGRARQTRLDCR